MVWRLPPLNSIKAFEAAGRLGSFSRAAKELSVTPGAVSRQVKLLEDYVGVRLFERFNREVRLTDAGARYLQSVTQGLEVIHVATTQFAGLRLKSSLRVSSSITVLMRWLIPRLIRFHTVHPGADVQLSTSLKPIDFRIDDVDIAIRLGTGAWPNARADLLMASKLVLVCAPTLAARHPIVNPRQLADQTFLHSTVRPNNWAVWLRGVGAADLVTGRSIDFESSSLALQAAVEGMGYAVAPLQFVAADIEGGRLVVPYPHAVTESDRFYIVYAEGPVANPLLRSLRDWMMEEGRTDDDALARIVTGVIQHEAHSASSTHRKSRGE